MGTLARRKARAAERAADSGADPEPPESTGPDDADAVEAATSGKDGEGK